MGTLGRCCRRCAQLAVGLLALAVALVIACLCLEPPAALLPPPTDASACESRVPEAKVGPPHLRKVADFDLVLYGATGFTGRLATRYLAFAPGEFTFAIAGRDWGKLDSLDAEIGREVKQAGRGREPAAILVSDSKDVDGLRKIVRKARVVLALAGPYLRSGSNLVKVCAEEGTHYADISGESLWQRRMVDGNAAKAQFSGAKIVIAAGYDSAPFDLGAGLALRALDAAAGGAAPVRNATVTAVVTRMRGGVSGGTLASGMGMLELQRSGKVPAEWADDPYLLSPRASCRVDATVSGWGRLRYDRHLGVAGVPHFMAPVNARIVRRSLELTGRHGVSYGEGMSLGAILDAIFFSLRWGSKSLKPPSPGEGPPPAVQHNGGYEALVVARDRDSGRTAKVELRGRGDPGYMHTSRLLAEVGLCLLNAACHRAGMGGGIHTTVSAMDPDVLAERFRAAKHEDGRPLLDIGIVANSAKHASEL